MADFSELVEQLKQNNRSEAGRDSTHTREMRNQNKTLQEISGKQDSVIETNRNISTTTVSTASEDIPTITAPTASDLEEQDDEQKNDNKRNTLLEKLVGVSKSGFGAIGKSVGNVAGKAKAGIMGLVKGTLFAGLLVAVVAFLNSPFFIKTLEFIDKEIMPALFNFYNNIIKPLGIGIFDFIKNEVFPGIAEVFTKIGNVFEEVKAKTNNFQFIRETTLPAIMETLSIQFENLKRIVMKVVDFVGNIAKGDFEKALGDFGGIALLLGKIIDDGITGALRALGVEFEGTAADAVVRFVKDINDKIKKFFSDIIKGIENSIRSITGGGFLADKIFGKETEQEKSERALKEVNDKIAKLEQTDPRVDPTTALGKRILENRAKEIEELKAERGKLENLVNQPGLLTMEDDKEREKLSPEQQKALAATVDDVTVKRSLTETVTNLVTGDSGKSQLVLRKEKEAREKAELEARQAAMARVGPVPGLQMGGPVERGEDYLVGETGPEIFVPSNTGLVISAQRTAQLAEAAVQRRLDMTGGGDAGSAPIINTTNTVATNNSSNTTVSSTSLTPPNLILKTANASV